VEIRYELVMLVVILDLFPQNGNVGLHLGVINDVVKGNQAVNKRGVELEVSLRTRVGVIAVDEEKVDGATVEDLLHQLPRLALLRVCKPGMNFLFCACEGLQLVKISGSISVRAERSCVIPTGKVDGDEGRVVSGYLAPGPEGSALGCSNLQDGLGLSLLDEIEEGGKFEVFLDSTPTD